jgi:hypothetical protein
MQGAEKSITEKILDVFGEGPGMIADVVLETGMEPRQVSANMNYLVRTHRLRRRLFHVPAEMHKPGKSVVWLYYLPSHERKAA